MVVQLPKALKFNRLVNAKNIAQGRFTGVCPVNSDHRLQIEFTQADLVVSCEFGCNVWQHFKSQHGFGHCDIVYDPDELKTCSVQARAFLDAGICIIPLVCDGSKKPAVFWTPFKDQLPKTGQLDHWCRSVVGFAVVCGEVSGGLEVLDFDDDADETYSAWREITDDVSCRLPVVETPSNGYHVYYRCTEITGNKKIAWGESGKVRIESRGQHGYVVSTFSRPEVHSRNYPYVQVAGPVLPEIPLITPEERKKLWLAADEFDLRETRKKAIMAVKSKAVRRPIRANHGNVADRAQKYVAKMPPAISGSNGHNITFSVACKLAIGFGLEWKDAFSILQEYNQRCEPPWSDNELHHKLKSAFETSGARGELV